MQILQFQLHHHCIALLLLKSFFLVRYLKKAFTLFSIFHKYIFLVYFTFVELSKMKMVTTVCTLSTICDWFAGEQCFLFFWLLTFTLLIY